MPSLKVKLSDGTTNPIEVPEDFTEKTVKDLKEHLASKINIEAAIQRMVFKGKILKDEDLCKTVGLADGLTVHVVKGRAAGAPANTAPEPTPAPAPTNAAPENPSAQNNNQQAAANPYAALFGGGMGGANQGGAQQQQQPNANPMGGMGGMGGGGMGMGMWPGMGAGMGMGAGAQGGGMGGAGGMDPMAAQMMNNPQMMQMAMNMWQQNPQMMAEMTRSHPMFQSMDPQQREAVIQMMSNPQMMQSMMAMQGMGGGMGAGMGGMGMGGMGGGMGGANNQNQNQNNQQGGAAPAANNMGMGGGMGMGGFPGMGMGGMGGGMGGGFGAPQAPANPRETYKDQLAQLQAMGFPNEEANIAALVQSQGSVDFAIERLLNS